MKLIVGMFICVVVGAVSLGILTVNTGNAELSIAYDEERAEAVVDRVIDSASNGFGLMEQSDE